MATQLVREEFLKTVQIANRFIPLRPSIPVLGNILLKGSKGKLELFATNLESSVRLSLPAKNEEAWEITTPAKILSDFVGSADSTEVTLKLEKESVTVQSGDLTGVLAGIAASEFPTLPESTEKGIEFELKTLQEAVNNVAFASSNDEGKPILTGIYLNQENEQTIIVATDGFRLAKRTLPKKYAFNQVVIPAKALVESLKIAGEMEESLVGLVISKDQNQIVLKGDSFEISSRLLDGTYPNFQQIIPQKFVTEIKVDKAKVTAAIKATAVFARDVGNVVKLTIKANQLSLMANTAQVGEGSATLDVESSGEDLVVVFNSRYLLDGLSAVKGNLVTFKFSGALSPGIISSDEEKDFFYVVMPVKAQN